MLLGLAGTANAQQAPAPEPPPGYEYDSRTPTAPIPYTAPPNVTVYVPEQATPQPGAPLVPTNGPKLLHYEPGEPIPAGYHVESQSRRGLVIGGAVTFGVMYAISLLAGAIGSDSGTTDCGYHYGSNYTCVTVKNKDNWTPMYIPAIGPFITLGTVDHSESGAFGLVFLGLAQSAGAAMLAGGIMSPVQRLVRNDIAKVTVTPMLGTGVAGLGLSGTM